MSRANRATAAAWRAARWSRMSSERIRPGEHAPGQRHVLLGAPAGLLEQVRHVGEREQRRQRERDPADADLQVDARAGDRQHDVDRQARPVLAATPPAPATRSPRNSSWIGRDDREVERRRTRSHRRARSRNVVQRDLARLGASARMRFAATSADATPPSRLKATAIARACEAAADAASSDIAAACARRRTDRGNAAASSATMNDAEIDARPCASGHTASPATTARTASTDAERVCGLRESPAAGQCDHDARDHNRATRSHVAGWRTSVRRSAGTAMDPTMLEGIASCSEIQRLALAISRPRRTCIAAPPCRNSGLDSPVGMFAGRQYGADMSVCDWITAVKAVASSCTVWSTLCNLWIAAIAAFSPTFPVHALPEDERGGCVAQRQPQYAACLGAAFRLP